MAEQLCDKLQLLHDARRMLADLREQKNAVVAEKQRVLQVQQPRLMTCLKVVIFL